MRSLTFPKTDTQTQLSLVLAGAFSGVAFYFLRDLIIADLNAWLGLIMLPFLWLLQPGKFSWRYLFPAALFVGLAIAFPVKTLVLLAVLFGLLFLVESTLGKVSFYVLFLLLILSNIFRYFSNFIGFPIRLWLSEIAGKILILTGQKVEVTGNLISLNGEDFSVDPACAGLKMLATSLLLALFILAFYQKQTGRPVSFLMATGFLVFTFLLNVGANLFRIVLLVLFRIPPESIFHDLVGIICLALYVIVPLLAVSSRLRQDPVSPKEGQNPAAPGFPVYGLTVSFLLLLATVFTANRTAERKAVLMAAGNELQLTGFEEKQMAEGITRFRNKEVLLYLKPVHFYSAEHNPTVCWTGSGYDFTRIQKRQVNGVEIYTGTLQKGEEKLYTAWWFEQGNVKTISHWKWRTEAFKTESKFHLVNLSAANPETLEQYLNQFLKPSILESESN